VGRLRKYELGNMVLDASTRAAAAGTDAQGSIYSGDGGQRVHKHALGSQVCCAAAGAATADGDTQGSIDRGWGFTEWQCVGPGLLQQCSVGTARPVCQEELPLGVFRCSQFTNTG
jgi:hypothetical protein